MSWYYSSSHLVRATPAALSNGPYVAEFRGRGNLSPFVSWKYLPDLFHRSFFFFFLTSISTVYFIKRISSITGQPVQNKHSALWPWVYAHKRPRTCTFSPLHVPGPVRNVCLPFPFFLGDSVPSWEASSENRKKDTKVESGKLISGTLFIDELWLP